MTIVVCQLVCIVSFGLQVAHTYCDWQSIIGGLIITVIILNIKQHHFISKGDTSLEKIACRMVKRCEMNWQ
jgi:hypothetical protein